MRETKADSRLKQVATNELAREGRDDQIALANDGGGPENTFIGQKIAEAVETPVEHRRIIGNAGY